MDAGGGQMRDPPHGHKEPEQKPIQTGAISNQARFQVPAAAFAILKSGLDAHPIGVLADATPASGLVGNEQPGLLMIGFPHRTYLRFNGLVLPEQNAPEPLLTRFEDDLAQWRPVAPLASHPAPTRMLLAHPQQIMPLASSTQLHQGKAG